MRRLTSLLLPIVLTLSFGLSCLGQSIRFIPIHFHSDPEVGSTRAQADNQIKNLNQIYSDQNTPFRFTIHSIDNEPIRKGGAGDLNVYVHEIPTRPFYVLAYATWPWNYKKEPELDGIHLRPLVADSGVVLAHEIGHWLGIYHDSVPLRYGIPNCMDTPKMETTDKRCYFNSEQLETMRVNYDLYRK